LFTIDDILHLPLVGEAFATVDKKYPNLDQDRRRHEALRRVFGTMVEDVLTESRIWLEKSGAQTASDIRTLGHPVIAFSDDLLSGLNAIREFLYANMYRAPSVLTVRQDMTDILRQLFHRFMDNPDRLPEGWDASQDDFARARLVADYVSGMTDRYALKLHKDEAE
jgi:dGTPase